ncbi:MAG: ABC transporter substrate-binding protein [Synechococcaceae cyanobacterium RM1_1_27]|nr:ABC transporter substrate-binding protein [Synechococcaceae cyanobacterium RM1_1_27]
MMDLNLMGSLRRRQALQLITALASSSLLVGHGSRQVGAQSLDPGSLAWEDVVAQARGTRVNWAMWSGSDIINGYVDGWVADRLKAEFDISLNRVPLGDTVEAVNKVVGEVQAGLTSGGDIDLIWINGVNFRTLKQGNLLYGPFVDVLPSSEFYRLEDPRVGTDFGLPTEGYSAPYTGSYFAMAYDAARISQPPQSFDELLVWAEANPGRFGYVAPPDFNGNRFCSAFCMG